MAQQSDCALHIVLVGQRPVKSHKIAQDRTKTLVDGVVYMDYWRNGRVELRPQSGAFLLRSMSKLLDVNKLGRTPKFRAIEGAQWFFPAIHYATQDFILAQL